MGAMMIAALIKTKATIRTASTSISQTARRKGSDPCHRRLKKWTILMRPLATATGDGDRPETRLRPSRLGKVKERRPHAAMGIPLFLEAELGEDRVDVLLDGPLR